MQHSQLIKTVSCIDVVEPRTHGMGHQLYGLLFILPKISIFYCGCHFEWHTTRVY